MESKSIIKDIEPDELFNVVDRVLEVYRSNGKKREKFPKFLDRYGLG
jgi:precorrin-3B C17-methyltransferase